ncbi:beta-1,3-galactosyl-o-glycosyl-glycoprotein beta-1,6-n-acetylglucosaminyltransferase 3-like [Plakobranchus ocellatus]|uniref:Beta-1,3-galactosyl-o-glycosyl-glycoprotein beta-1,6-n-acetylglucosaminyltransferase 3-like n=1 Tax=Plakobranchus ocellatus TaxID=259542 RepID=A0AAV4AHP9_9GAST|nr:beta-1,3-galactosyl-o-glycosyl-glycoprotein beta-1,6-n-acetylglucosaminyltransferase 3-like [Plakobranchus ocellatus]
MAESSNRVTFLSAVFRGVGIRSFIIVSILGICFTFVTYLNYGSFIKLIPKIVLMLNNSRRFRNSEKEYIYSMEDIVVESKPNRTAERDSVVYAVENITVDSKPNITAQSDAAVYFSEKNFTSIERNYHQTQVNCSAVFAGIKEEVDRAVAIATVLATEVDGDKYSKDRLAAKKAKNDTLYSETESEVKEWAWKVKKLDNQWYLNATQDCDYFKRTRGYITSSLTQEEEEFPIAFSLIVYKDIEMVERLLRSIYRPQNRYCIHVDAKSDQEFFEAVQSIAHCFSDNVALSSRRMKVVWGKYTVLELELICMGDLWVLDDNETPLGKSSTKINYISSSLYSITPGNVYRPDSTESGGGTKRDTAERSDAKRRKWKYFINLTGQEFPLKTNYELVKILKAYKGANNEDGTRMRADIKRWVAFPPHGIQPAKGAVHTLLNRATVDFILHDSIAKDFVGWLRKTKIPDETLFASINYNRDLQIPGTYNGTDLEQVISYNRYKHWYGTICYSEQHVRGICILSIGDLQRLGEAPHLFANKFYLHQDRIVIGCLEEKIFNDTRDEFLGRKTFNTTFYSEQDFVINRVRGAVILSLKMSKCLLKDVDGAVTREMVPKSAQTSRREFQFEPIRNALI